VSRWFITINTNKTSLDEVKRLRDAYEAMFNNIRRFFKFLEGSPQDIISSVDDPVIGIGNVYGRVHIHSLITVNHKAKIHLDYDKVREYFKRALGYPVHFDAKSLKDTEINIRNYLLKNYEESEHINYMLKNFEEMDVKELNEL